MYGENTVWLSMNRGNTLNIPVVKSKASLESWHHSPSSDGGDTLTVRPSASVSNASSVRSSSVTLAVCESNERLLHTHLSTEDDPLLVDHGMFAFSAETLAHMFNPKSVSAFRALGGLPELAKGLATDCDAGLNEATEYGTISPHPLVRSSRREPYADRKAVFGENRLPEKKQKSLLRLMLIALDDKVLIILSITSLISLALGLYQTFGLPHAPGEPRVEWVDGVTIMTAVAIAVVLGALNDYQKERQFAKLNRKVRDISSPLLIAP